jgi:hypothetical protein
LLNKSNNNFVPGNHFEDEVLVPEAAKTKTLNVPKSFTRTTNLPPKIPLGLEVFQKGHDLTEARND